MDTEAAELKPTPDPWPDYSLRTFRQIKALRVQLSTARAVDRGEIVARIEAVKAAWYKRWTKRHKKQ